MPSTLLQTKRGGSQKVEEGLKKYFEQREERNFALKNPQFTHSFSIDDILADQRRQDAAGSRDGMVVRRTSFRNQMKREGRLRRDGSVKQGRRFAGAIRSFADDDGDRVDIEMPGEGPRRGRRREKPPRAREPRARGPRRRGESAPADRRPKSYIPTEGLTAVQLANLGRQLVVDGRAKGTGPPPTPQTRRKRDEQRRSESAPPDGRTAPDAAARAREALGIATQGTKAERFAKNFPMSAKAPPPGYADRYGGLAAPPIAKTTPRAQPYMSATTAKAGHHDTFASLYLAQATQTFSTFVGSLYEDPASRKAPAAREKSREPKPKKDKAAKKKKDAKVSSAK